MGRGSAKFEIITPFGNPQTPGFSLSLLTHKEWANLAEVVNAELVDIDPLADQPVTQAVIPTWTYGTDDTRLADWTVLPAPHEEARVDDVATTLQTEIDSLTELETLTTEQAQRLADLQRDLAQVQTYRFWQEVENAFGDGNTSLYRACNAANVPFKIRSNNRLEADRPFTFWFHRCKPHEAQASSWVRLRFGHWALTIRQDAEVELTRYRDGHWYEDDETNPGRGQGTWHVANGLDWAHIEAVEAQVADLRDSGRLNATDRANIADLKAQIAGLRADYKRTIATPGMMAADKKAAKAVTDAQVTALRTQIDALKEAKVGLNAAHEAQIASLDKGIIAERRTLAFSHMAESLIGNDVALTIIPQPRGFLVTHCSRGRDYCVYADAEVLATGQDATVVADTPLQLDGNGGALWFGITRPIPAQTGHLLSHERAAGGAAANLTSINLDATVPPGTTVMPTVTANSRNDSFSWRIDYTTSGARWPFLYRAYLEIPATPRDLEQEEVLFDSSDETDVLWEVGASYSRENRGRAITLTVIFAVADHPDLLTRSECQVKFYENDDCWFTGILRGPDSVEIVNADWRRVTYRGYDRWYLLRSSKMYFEVIGDGKAKGAYLRQLAEGVGLTSSEIVIGSTGVLAQTLPVAPPGEQPLLLPEFGASRADWMTRLHDDFLYMTDLYFDGDGALHIVPLASYTTPLFAFHSTARTGASDLLYMHEPVSSENWEEYVNSLVVYGAEVNGYKLSALWQDHASAEQGATPGRWIAAEPYENQALRTQALVNACCRWRADRYCRPYVEWQFTAHYHEGLATGDRITCNTALCEVVELRWDERSGEQMQVKARVL